MKHFIGAMVLAVAGGSLIRTREGERHQRKPIDCTYSSSYPRQYVASHLRGAPIIIDGQLDEAAWLDAPWTEDFIDISTDTKPRFQTRAKIRWSVV
jgi:hypothetical protein